MDLPDRRPRLPPERPESALEEATFEALELAVEVDRTPLVVGDAGHGSLVLRNKGARQIGPLYAEAPITGVLENSAGEAVGGYVGWIAGTGVTIDLAPGGSVRIPLLFGTASSREALGYTLPPGDYWLRVRMPFAYQGERGGHTHAITAPLTQMTVVPAAPPEAR